jgi:hypothetical protein
MSSIMASPITLETLIGYLPTEDVYIRFTEYYGDGTIYGRTELSMPDGSPVKGEGKFKKELVEAGVLMSEVVAGSLGGDLVWVANEAPVEAPAEVPVEAPAEVPVEVPVEVPLEVPLEVPVEAPAEVPVEAPVDVKAKTYMVVASVLGFKVSREFNVKIDELTNTLYLE